MTIIPRPVFVMLLVLASTVLCGDEPTLQVQKKSEGGSALGRQPWWLDLRLKLPTARAVRPDGRQAIVSDNLVAHAVNLPTEDRIHTWPLRLHVVQYSGDGKSLLAVSDDQAVVYNTETFEVRQSWPSPYLTNGKNRGFAAAISHDGSRVALTYHELMERSPGERIRRRAYRVGVFDCRDGQEVFSATFVDKAPVATLNFLCDAKRLVICHFSSLQPSTPASGQLWDVDESRLLKEVDQANRVIVDSKQKLFATCRTRDTNPIEIFEGQDGTVKAVFEHGNLVRDLAFNPDSTRLVAVQTIDRRRRNTEGAKITTSEIDAVSKITQWELVTSKITFEHFNNEFEFSSVDYDAEGNRIVAIIDKPNGVDDDVDKYLAVWDANTFRPLRTAAKMIPFERFVFRPDSDELIGLNSEFERMSVHSGRCESSIQKYRQVQRFVQFKPTQATIDLGDRSVDLVNGKVAAQELVNPYRKLILGGSTIFSTEYGRLSLIDRSSNQLSWAFDLKSGHGVGDTKVTMDGRTIVHAQSIGGYPEGRHRIFIIRTKQADQPTVLDRSAHRLAIDPSEETFAAASHQTIDECSLADGKHRRVIGEVPGWVLSMEYVDDGSLLVACGVIGHQRTHYFHPKTNPGWARVYDLKEERVIELKGHTAAVTAMSIDSRRRRVATASNDGTLRFWNLDTGDCLWTFQGHHSLISDVDISDDGKLLASAGDDGVAIWQIAGVVDPDVSPVKLADTLSGETGKIWSSWRGPKFSPGWEQVPEDRRAYVVDIGDPRRKWYSTAGMYFWLASHRRDKAEAQVADIPPRPIEIANDRDGPATRSADRTRLVFTYWREKEVKVVDDDYEVLQRWPLQVQRSQVALSPNGDRMFVLSKSKLEKNDSVNVDIYSVETGAKIKTIEKIPCRSDTLIRMSPSGSTMMLRSGPLTVDFRSADDGKLLGQIENVEFYERLAPRYSPDEKLIATYEREGHHIVLCDSLTLRPLARIASDLPVEWFRFLPDSNRLLVGQSYESARQWLTMWNIKSVESEKPDRLWSYAGPADGDGHFDRDGSRYFSNDRGVLWTLWNTQKGFVELAVKITRSIGDELVLSSDGRSIHFYTDDGPIVWARP